MIKLLLVEDEDGAIEVFKKLLQFHEEEVDFLGAIKTVAEAVPKIKEKEPDVVVLDISLPDGTGFDILDLIGNINFEVIFLTAYENYAIRAIKSNAFDYLLKPLQSSEMNAALRKVRSKIESKHSNKKSKKLALHTIEGVEFITMTDIVSLKAESNYTEIRTVHNEKFLASKTLKSFGPALTTAFFRVHKSYIVNVDMIKKFDKSDSTVYLNDGSAYPLSKSRKDDLLKMLTV